VARTTCCPGVRSTQEAVFLVPEFRKALEQAEGLPAP
jgi:hypothetical protein